MIAPPAVKVLAVTEPLPKDGAESVPRMVTVAEEGVPMETDPVVSAVTLSKVTVTVSSPSCTPSLLTTNELKDCVFPINAAEVIAAMFKSLVFQASPLPDCVTFTLKVPVTPLNVAVKVIVSPSSTWRPGQAVSLSPLRLPLVPQLAGVPAQLPLAEMVTV